MDIGMLNAWLPSINIVGTFSIGAWLYLEKRSDKTNERITTLAARVAQIDRDVSTLTASSEAAPSHSDLSAVYRSINELSETVNQLVGENRGQSDTLRMILNQIMQKGL